MKPMNNGKNAMTSGPGQLRPDDPLSDVETMEQLRERIASAEYWSDWASRNPDGGSVIVEGESIELTSKHVNALRLKSEAILAHHAPARLAWFERRDASLSQVARYYPALLDPSSPEFEAAKGYLEGCPEIKRFPDFPMLIGDYVAAELARKRKAQADEKN
jgi:hypothetical protein